MKAETYFFPACERLKISILIVECVKNYRPLQSSPEISVVPTLIRWTR